MKGEADNQAGDIAPASPAPVSGSALAPLRHSFFKAIWIANLGSNFGGLIQTVGASWMMVMIAGSASMVALIQTATTLPILLFSLIAGAVADGFDRRKVMIGAQLAMLIFSALLSVLAFEHLVTPWTLLIFTFLIGCGAAFSNPAWQSSVADLVPKAELPAAIALNSMAFNIARSTGPAVGGVIVAVAGAAAAFLVNAVSYIALVVILFRWQPPVSIDPLPRERLRDAVTSGLRYAALSPHLRVMILRAGVASITGCAALALMPLVTHDVIIGGPVIFGLLLGAFGGGAVVGALLNSRLRHAFSTEFIIRGAGAALALGTFVFGLGHSLIAALPALFLAGAGWMLTFSSFSVLIQLSSPRWVLGRAFSLYNMTLFGGAAGGSWLWGAITDGLNVSDALLLSGVAQLLGLALAFLLPIAEVEGWNLAPLNRWREPHLPIAPNSGPIVISVEYRIRETDVAEFLDIMAEARRIRRRDGAQGWVLTQDIRTPELWAERFRTATWVEYVRHSQRRTFEDAPVSERLRALHYGDEPPTVRWWIERQTRPSVTGSLTTSPPP